MLLYGAAFFKMYKYICFIFIVHKGKTWEREFANAENLPIHHEIEKAGKVFFRPSGNAQSVNPQAWEMEHFFRHHKYCTINFSTAYKNCLHGIADEQYKIFYFIHKGTGA